MILPRGYVAIELVTEQGSSHYHEALAALATPEGRQGRLWAGIVRDLARTHTEVPGPDENAIWARLFLLRVEGEGELLPNPAPGIRVWLPEEDAPIQAGQQEARAGAHLIGVPYLQRFLAYLGEGVEPEPEPALGLQAEPEPENEPGQVPEPEWVPEPEAAEVEAEPETEPEVPVEQEEPEPEPEPEPEVELEQVPEPGSGADPRIPQTTTTGAMPLVEGMTIEIASGRVGWYTTIARNGAVVCEDISATEPWLDRRAVGRLTSTIRGRIPTLDQGAVREALTAVLDQLRGSPDGQALTAEAVSRVLQATETVQIELTDPPVYVVGLRGGGTLTFSAREIAAIQPVALNERWLTARPREPLGATRRDFAAILSYWFSIAEEIEALGAHSVWEAVAEALQTEIAPLPLETDQTALARYGLYLDGTRTMWVTSRVIQGVIRGAGQDPNDPRFARYLQDRGILVTRSRLIRSGGAPLRAWGLDPTFKPESESGTLVPIPMSGGCAHEV
jgi:hypothetical protein